MHILIISSSQNTTYNEALYSAWGNQGPSRTAMPSISRLQKMVEAAWAQGFDVQVNISKQIGTAINDILFLVEIIVYFFKGNLFW